MPAEINYNICKFLNVPQKYIVSMIIALNNYKLQTLYRISVMHTCGASDVTPYWSYHHHTHLIRPVVIPLSSRDVQNNIKLQIAQLKLAFDGFDNDWGGTIEINPVRTY